MSNAKSLAQLPQNTGGLELPHSESIEAYIIGSLIVDEDARRLVIHRVKPEYFYYPKHQEIIRVIQDLFNEGRAIDFVIIMEELERRGKLQEIGEDYLIRLSQTIATQQNIEEHVQILIDHYMYRELARIGYELQQKALEHRKHPTDILERAIHEITELIQHTSRGTYLHIKDIYEDFIEKLHEIAADEDREGIMTGLPSGFLYLDRITGGWKPGELIILAARPGMGKTSFMLTLAYKLAVNYEKPVGIFSMEMGAEQLLMRLLSMATYTPMQDFKHGKFTPEKLVKIEKEAQELIQAPIYIDDTAHMNLIEFKSKAMLMKARHNIQVIFVDYLQLMSAGNIRGTREQEVSAISRTLKSVAKELEVPIIAVSQLSRRVEQRADSKRPQLSDLRESGAIEQDADLVLFLYRPEYHGLEPDVLIEKGIPPNQTQGYTELIIAKHRNGPTGTVPIRFNSEITMFEPANLWLDALGIGQEEDTTKIVTKRSSASDDIGGDEDYLPMEGDSNLFLDDDEEFDIGEDSGDDSIGDIPF
ncbi:MAG: replicative DNA helicase [Chlorobi bacterium]|nr:replicative DNA helicase [Chlorobiota bacterium]